MERFNRALTVVKEVLTEELRGVRERIKAEEAFDAIEKEELENGVVVLHNFSPIWRDMLDVDFAILPNPQGWALNAKDTSVKAIPDSVDNADDLIFAHGGRFIAVFKTLEAAKAFAATL